MSVIIANGQWALFPARFIKFRCYLTETFCSSTRRPFLAPLGTRPRNDVLIRLLQVASFERSKMYGLGLWFWFTGVWLAGEVVCSRCVALVDVCVCVCARARARGNPPKYHHFRLQSRPVGNDIPEANSPVLANRPKVQRRNHLAGVPEFRPLLT